MDPMYPSNAKRQGKSKKHAQLLQALCSEPCPLAESILLDAALIAATHRVRAMCRAPVLYCFHTPQCSIVWSQSDRNDNRVRGSQAAL